MSTGVDVNTCDTCGGLDLSLDTDTEVLVDLELNLEGGEVNAGVDTEVNVEASAAVNSDNGKRALRSY